MKVLSDALQAIATDLGMDYYRAKNLTEANVDIYYKKYANPIMIYEGPSDITTSFDGAMIIDSMASNIHFLVKGTSTDMKMEQIEDLLSVTKRLADKTYAALNTTYAVKDIEPYTLEAETILTEVMIGHLMQITVPFYNEGC